MLDHLKRYNSSKYRLQTATFDYRPLELISCHSSKLPKNSLKIVGTLKSSKYKYVSKDELQSIFDKFKDLKNKFN